MSLKRSSFEKEFQEYWGAYGGFKAFVCSPYLWIAFSLMIVGYLQPIFKDIGDDIPLEFLWTCFNDYTQHDDCWIWYKTALSIFPSMLGFTLGGYTIMLALGNEKFQEVIRGPKENGKKSSYIKISASLCHFVLLQVITLILAVFFDSLQIKNFWLNLFGTWLLYYALVLSISACMSVFFLSRMYDKMPKTCSYR